MSKFSMTCTCGDTMAVDAENREAAVSQFKTMMDEKRIAARMNAKHPGEPVISVADCHAMIEKQVVAA